MKYEKIKEKNYDIYLIKTDKFKTINVSTLLFNKYNKNNVTKEKFISDFLINTNNNAKTEVLMSKKYMELYEPRISVNDVFRDIHMKIFDITFLNEKYTEKDMNKKTINFYYDIIFNPNTCEDGLDEKSFKINKEAYKSIYMRNKEDSSSTAYFNALKNISEDNPVKIDIRGSIEDLEKIDRKECLNYYLNELKNSKFMVFVTGDYTNELIDIIKNNLDNKVNNVNIDYLKEFNVEKVINEREIIDESNFKQSIVYIIYKIIGMSSYEREVVLPILNNVLGGSSSKLFNNVREKHSLAYYAYSDYLSSYNILYMYAGISNNNYKETVKLMKNQLNEIMNGNITNEELSGAKETIISSILKSEDRITGIANSLKSNIISGISLNEELKEKIKSVTKEDLINLSRKLELDLTYLLKGEKDENN